LVKNFQQIEAFMKTLVPILFALATALCWGLYGPTLGKARAADLTASPFKPYVGIGVAYLLIAIIGGLIAMKIVGKDSFNFTDSVTRWGFAAGIWGALGALCLTIAMFSGGNKIPHAVMPIVFGGAVTVTALYGLWMSDGALKGGTGLWIGIAGMAISVILIAANTPQTHPPKPVANAPSFSYKSNESGLTELSNKSDLPGKSNH
jgi:hypothetical protein